MAYRNGGLVQRGAGPGKHKKSLTPEGVRLAHLDETGGWSLIEMVTVKLKVMP